PGRTRDQHLHEPGARRPVELSVAFCQGGAEGGIVVKSEPFHGLDLKMAVPEESLTKLPQIVRSVHYECLQSRLPHREVGLFVQNERLDFIERAPVAEEHIELPDKPGE